MKACDWIWDADVRGERRWLASSPSIYFPHRRQVDAWSRLKRYARSAIWPSTSCVTFKLKVRKNCCRMP